MANPPVQPSELYRDFVTPGNPLSGAYRPPKADARALNQWFLDQINTILAAGGFDGSSLADIKNRVDAILAGAPDSFNSFAEALTALNAEIARAKQSEQDLGGRADTEAAARIAADIVTSRLAARYAGVALAEIGAGIPQLVLATVGNALVNGAAAPAGSIWVDGYTVLDDGAIDTIGYHFEAVGNGIGYVVLLSPLSGGRHQIEAAYQLPTITAAGSGAPPLIVTAGIDIPAIGVPRGWRTGFWSPAGGAQLSFTNPANGSSLGFAIAGLPVGVPFTFTTGAAQLSIQVTYRKVADIGLGYPIVAGAAGAAADKTLWLPPIVLSVACPVKTLSVYVQTAGNGVGRFAFARNVGGNSYVVDKFVQISGLTVGAHTFMAGMDFPALDAKAGWALGWYAPDGGAQIAYGPGDLYGFVPGATTLVEGQRVTVQSPSGGATFSLAMTVGGTINALAPRMAAVEATASALKSSSALLTQSYTADVVTDLAAQVSGTSVILTGTLRRNGVDYPISGSVPLDAAGGGAATDEAHTLVNSAVSWAASATTNRLTYANVSGVVVRDAGSGLALVENTDYQVNYDHGVVALIATGTRAAKISYAWTKRRYDAITLDPESLTLAVVKGTERDRDAAEYVPTVAGTVVRLCNVRVSGRGLVVVPTWDRDHELGIRRSLVAQAESDRRRNGSALRRTRSLLVKGLPVTVASQGDSIVAIQSQPPADKSVPNTAYRDRATATGTAFQYLADAMAADTIATLPLYDNGDGAGQVHSRMSLAWSFMQRLGAIGSAVTYLNFGVAGEASSDGITAPLKAAVANSAADVVILHYGQNELGSGATYANIVSILTGLYAAGKDVIVVAPPRTNLIGGAFDTAWTFTVRALRRAAEWIDPATGKSAAFVDTSLIYADDTLGGLGIARVDMCAANLFNHPGIREHAHIGRLAAHLCTPADSEGLPETGAWKDFTPVLGSPGGALGSGAVAAMRYRKTGKTVFWEATASIPNNGAGNYFVTMTLPSTARNAGVCLGRDTKTGKQLQGYANQTSTLSIQFYDGTYPGQSGAAFLLSGFYEEA